MLSKTKVETLLDISINNKETQINLFHFHSKIRVKKRKIKIKKLNKKKFFIESTKLKVNKISVSKTIKIKSKKINCREYLSWICPIVKNPASKQPLFLDKK